MEKIPTNDSNSRYDTNSARYDSRILTSHLHRMEQAFAKALREFFPRLKTGDKKADFFAVYKES